MQRMQRYRYSDDFLKSKVKINQDFITIGQLLDILTLPNNHINDILYLQKILRKEYKEYFSKVNF